MVMAKYFLSDYWKTNFFTKNPPNTYPSKNPRLAITSAPRKISTIWPSKKSRETFSQLPSYFPGQFSIFDNIQTHWMSDKIINCECTSQIQFKCNKIPWWSKKKFFQLSWFNTGNEYEDFHYCGLSEHPSGYPSGEPSIMSYVAPLNHCSNNQLHTHQLFQVSLISVRPHFFHYFKHQRLKLHDPYQFLHQPRVWIHVQFQVIYLELQHQKFLAQYLHHSQSQLHMKLQVDIPVMISQSCFIYPLLKHCNKNQVQTYHLFQVSLVSINPQAFRHFNHHSGKPQDPDQSLCQSLVCIHMQFQVIHLIIQH